MNYLYTSYYKINIQAFKAILNKIKIESKCEVVNK